jgi:hypothetical protein
MWLIAPSSAAEAVGRPLLQGAARTTEVGDPSGFFLCLGGFALDDAIRRQTTVIRCAACLVGIVAVTRTDPSAAHGAAFTTQYIAIELVCGALLLLSASRLDRDATTRPVVPARGQATALPVTAARGEVMALPVTAARGEVMALPVTPA